MKKILPLIMLLLGTGAGVGAGVMLRPAPAPVPPLADEPKETSPVEETITPAAGIQGREYVKLSNQFVVPIVQNERVASMVVMTLSVEVEEGQGQIVFDMEPKVRDVFLNVLFDFAAIGGFDGAFITNGNLDIITRNLTSAARKTFGGELISDVLIFEIARQDY